MYRICTGLSDNTEMIPRIKTPDDVELYTLADLGGGRRDARPPSGSNFLHFHAVFGKNWSNSMLAPPPLGLAPPRLGNPGSATGTDSVAWCNGFRM